MALFPEKVDMSMLKKKDGSPIATTVKTSSVAKDTLPKKIDMSMLSKKTATPVYEGNSDYQENMAMLEKMKANGYGSADEVSKGYTDYEKSKNTMDSVGTNAKAFGLGVSSGVANLGAVAPRAMVNIFGSSSKAAHNIIDNAERAEQRLGDYVNSIDGDYTGLKKEIAGGVGAVGASVPEMALDAGVMFATGGASLAGTSAKVGAKMTLKETAKQAAKEMVSPVNAVRLTRYFVNENDNALKDGASYGDAIKQALLYSVPAVIIEGSGGIDNVMKDVLKNGVSKNFQTSAMKLLQKTATSALEEGGEEVLQQIWERASQKATYDKDMKLVSNTERAIIEPANLARAGITGAVAGGLIGGGINGLNYAGSKLGKDTNVPAKNLVVEEGSAGEKPVNKVYGVLGDSVDNVVDNVPSEDINYITGVPVREEKMAAAKAEAKPALKNDYDEFYGYAGAPTSLDFVENGTTFGVNDTNNGVKTAKLVENSTNDLNNNANDSSFSSEKSSREFATIKEKIDSNLDLLQTMEPVSNLTGNEFPKTSEGIKGLQNRVVEFFKSIGNVVKRDDLGEVLLGTSGYKGTVHHGLYENKITAFKAVPDVIKNGTVISIDKKLKGRDYNTYLIAAPVKIKNLRYNMGVVLKSTDKNRYYLHDVYLDEEIKKEALLDLADITVQDGVTAPTQASTDSISQENGEVNGGASPDFVKKPAFEISAKRLQKVSSEIVNNKGAFYTVFNENLSKLAGRTFDTASGFAIKFPAGRPLDLLSVNSSNIDNPEVLTAFSHLPKILDNATFVDTNLNYSAYSSQFSMNNIAYEAKIAVDGDGDIAQVRIVSEYEGDYGSNNVDSFAPLDGSTIAEVDENIANSGAGNLLSEREEYNKVRSMVDPASLLSFKDKMQKGARNFYTNFVNGQYVFDRMSKLLGDNPKKTSISSCVQLVRQSAGSVDAICTNAMSDLDGNIIGESFAEVLDTIKDKEAYNRYSLLKHHISRLKVGKPVLEISSGEALKEIRILEAQKPQLKENHKAVQDWWKKFSRVWFVDSGLMSDDVFNQWQSMYPDYRPTFRFVDGELGSGKTVFEEDKTSISTAGQKGAVGSTVQLLRFDEAYLKHIDKIVRSARKNELYLAIAEAVDLNPIQLANFARKVEAPQEDVYTGPFGLERSSYDGSSRVSLEEEVDNFLDTVDKVDALDVQNGVYSLKMFKDGKMEILNISKDMFDGFGNLNFELEGAMKMINEKITQRFKGVTTGYNPFFAVKNVFRDIGTYAIQNTSKNQAQALASYGKAINQMRNNSDAFKQYKALGGMSSGYFYNNKGYSKKYVSSTESFAKDKALQFRDLVAFVGEYGEVIPRFAEYLSYVENNGDIPAVRKNAAFRAADVTTNFSRFGTSTKTLDAIVPYMNAAVQSMDKFARTFKAEPVKTVERAAAMLVLPTLVCLAFNGDNPNYEELDDRVKDTNWLWGVPGSEDENGNCTKFFRIPKTRQYAPIFSALVERCVRFAQNDETAFNHLGNTFASDFAPSNPVTDNVFTAMFFDLKSNKDFAGRAIVPSNLAELPPEYQYNSTTSKAGMVLSKLFGGVVGGVAGLGQPASPIQIDFLINSYGGFIGDMLLNSTSSKNNSLSDSLQSTFLEPIKRGVITDSAYSNDLDDSFYEASKQANVDSTIANLEIDPYSEKAVLPVERVKNFYAGISGEVSSLYSGERAMLSDETMNYSEKTDSSDEMRKILREKYRINYDAVADAQKKLESTSSAELERLQSNIAYNSGSDTVKAKATEYMYDLVYGEYIASGGMELSNSSTATSLYEDWQASGLNMSDYAALSATCIDHGFTRDTVGSVVDAKGEGIGVSTYLKYKKDTVGWKKAEVMAYVSKLNLTWQQKDYLLYSRGYAPTVK